MTYRGESKPSKNVAISEPALTTSTAVALVSAIIGLLVSFGFNLTDDQTIAILTVVTVAGPLVSGIITRSKVTPSAEVAVQVAPSGQLVAAEALPNVPNGAPVTTPRLVA